MHSIRTWGRCARRAARVLVAAALPAWAGADEQAPPPSPCGDGFVYVAGFEPHGVDPDTTALVVTRVAEGLRYGRASTPSSAVMSAVEVERLRNTKPEMLALALSQTGVANVNSTFQRLTKHALKMSGYVQGTIVRAAGHTTVRMELYCQPPDEGRREPTAAGPPAPAKSPAPGRGDEGFSSGSAAQDPATPVAIKVVRAGADAADDTLMQAVFRAASKLTSLANAMPVVRIAGGALRRVAAGEEVVVDGSATSDPDDDAIELAWRAVSEAPVSPEAWRDAGGSEALRPPTSPCVGWRQEAGQLRFSSSVPARCTFELTARELARERLSATERVVIEVIVPPHVRVAENALVEMAGRADIQLVGACENCTEWRWVQRAGPVTPPESWRLPASAPLEPGSAPGAAPARSGGPARTFPAECHGTGTQARCTVGARVAGEYTFALTGWNDLGEDRKEYAVAVAPPPMPLVYLPEKAITLHSYVFDGSASHDMLGGDLRYHWELSEKAFDNCDSTLAGEGARSADDRLTAPTSPRTGFSSTRTTPALHVRLTVFSTRKFGDRTSTSVACVERPIPVEDPTWLLALTGGSEWATRDRAWLGTRTSLVLAVRPSWLGPFALRAEQTLARNDGPHTDILALGGTFVGLSWIANRWFHPYVSGYLRTWGNSATGAQVGADFRVERFFYLSGGYRLEKPYDKDWRGVLTGTLGVGYDL